MWRSPLPILVDPAFSDDDCPHTNACSCGPIGSVKCCSSRLPSISIVPPTHLPYWRRQAQRYDDCLRNRSSAVGRTEFRSAWLAERLPPQGNVCSPVNNEEQSDDERSYILNLPHSPSWLNCLSTAHSANTAMSLRPFKVGMEFRGRWCLLEDMSVATCACSRSQANRRIKPHFTFQHRVCL